MFHHKVKVRFDGNRKIIKIAFKCDVQVTIREANQIIGVPDGKKLFIVFEVRMKDQTKE